MCNFAAWALAVYGTTLIVVWSKIFSPWRSWIAPRAPFWSSIVTCPTCFGFWVGLGFAVLAPRFGPAAQMDSCKPLALFVGAVSSSAWCTFAHQVLRRLGIDVVVSFAVQVEPEKPRAVRKAG